MVTTNSCNTYACSNFIVSATAGQGNYTTIASALTAASSGDTIFIKPGTYTENPTLKAGVNLCAFGCDSSLSDVSNVIINGTCTFTGAGTVTLFGLQLETNSGFCIAVTGSSASILNVNNCYINCTNNTGINYTSSSSSSKITFNYCSGNIATTGITLYSQTSGGTLTFVYCQMTNSGSSTTASNNSNGTASIRLTQFAHPISSSSTGAIRLSNVVINTNTTNTIGATINGTSLSQSYYTYFTTGSAAGLSIGTGATIKLFSCTILTTGSTAIAGAGTVEYGDISFDIGGTGVTTTTQTPFAFPTVQGGTGNTSNSAYAVLTGGTTSTSALQSVSGLGTSGQVLTSSGAAALPTWQTASGSVTLTGDTGSISGGSLTVYADLANNSNGGCGITVSFTNSGSTSTLNLTDGSENTCLGSQSGGTVTAGGGFNNTCVGNASGQSLNAGVRNTIIGQDAAGVFDGSDNLCLGSGSGSSFSGSESDNIVLVSNGISGDNNTIRIGIQGTSARQQNKCFVAGIVGVSPSSPQVVGINSSTGQLGVLSAIATSPANSSSSSLIIGTAYQNTQAYDVMITVYLAVTAATSASISLGVGSTSTPSQQTIVTGLTVGALSVIPVPIYIPAGYYALLSTTGTISISISGQITMAI